MSNELFQTIEQVAREKGIDVDVIVDAMQDAIVAASKKYYKTLENLVSRFNRETGELEVYAQKTVVEEVEDEDIEISLEEAQKIAPEATLDAIIEFPRSTEGLTRVAAQAAKQVIYQKVREAERENIYAEYIDRVGEIINGMVKRFERGDMIVDLGRTEAIIPRREQSRAEHYNPGDRVRAVILSVDKASKGPQVILSRSDPLLVKKLFEMEVPEIYDGTVIIETCVRDAGDRTKIAVRSNDRDIDPVGACVGMKGSRVQSVIRELRGEKIDIVQWSEDPLQLVQNALNPAKINRVTVLDEEDRLLEVVVSEDQLSLAIGKKGQNVRLAAQLTGWKIDIKSEAEKVREVERQMEHLTRSRNLVRELEGVDEGTGDALIEAGFETLEDIAQADTALLAALPALGSDESAEALRDAAADLLQQLIQEEEEHYAAEDEARRQAEEAERMGTLPGEGGVDELDAALGSVAQFLDGEDYAEDSGASEEGVPAEAGETAEEAVATAEAESDSVGGDAEPDSAEPERQP
ncbi:MAG: transcription termination/antitermination protein NusA [Xanthomonadales bacterium]|nr:transcription termination/antitermination protein NusA [Xanthomonadales bacterium]NIX11717.1 transcription termination/antitermination protein NusA [Xanthomonadales bacterium]